MKTLVYCPQSRNYPVAINSIKKIAGADRIVFDQSANDPTKHRFENCTNKCGSGRQLALDTDHDYLLLVDDDQVIPYDALLKLMSHDADIAYGFTVWRNPPHHWSPVLELSGEGHIVTMDMNRQVAEASWGTAVEVNGVGSFCTLIKRSALEILKFERRGQHCFDWYMACDAQKLGLRQVCDLSVHVGHMLDQTHVMWPSLFDPWPYRMEILGGTND